MAIVTKSDIFAKITEYSNSNDRKCPAKDLGKLLGVKTVVERKAFEKLLKEMKDNGEVLSKKGRGGGLYIPTGVDTGIEANSVETEEIVEDSNDDLIEAQPLDIDTEDIDPDTQDRSDESYQKLMEMSSGQIPMDEDWVKANWPEAWEGDSELDEATA